MSRVLLVGAAAFWALGTALGCGGSTTPNDGGAPSAQDAGLADAGPPDAGPPDAGPPPPDAGPCTDLDTLTPLTGDVPPTLSASQLYSDTAAKVLSEGVEQFAPAHALWSDGAVKTRWVYLPKCKTIDTSDMDHWVLPVGTRFWKEFAVDGKRIETRLIARYGPGPDDFHFISYRWNDSETEADAVPSGEQNVRGTQHDIPSVEQCKACHGYLPERSLGFSALQLSHAGPGPTMSTLSAAGRLSIPPAAGFAIPGDAKTQEMLGYIHANCGHCHNSNGVPFNNPFLLRLSVRDSALDQTDLWRTAVGVPVERFIHPMVTHRIKAGDPDSSCVTVRMSLRTGPTQQMPPIATEIVHAEGLQLIRDWISALPP